MGRCRKCDRLVTIVARELWGAGRARKWYPVSHPVLGDDTGGDPCPGEKEAL